MAKSGVEGVRHDPRYRKPYQARWTVNGEERMERFSSLEDAGEQVQKWKAEAAPPPNETMLDLYEGYVLSRHEVWLARQLAKPQPWTDDPIVASKKFTNDFRVLDPGSQYVVKMLQESGLSEEDALARAFLYRYTNRPETWDYLKRVLGRWPLASDMIPGGDLETALVNWRAWGETVFSGAYIIMPAPNTPGDKVRQVVALAHRLHHPQSPENVASAVLGARTHRGAFDALKANFGVGPFMTMQVLTDFGYYSPEWNENGFVIAGPGSKRGIAHLRRNESPEDTIAWIQEWWADQPVQPFVTVGERRDRTLSLMDIQNTFCEFSKYVRFKVRGDSTARSYRPAHPGIQPDPVLPLHW